jgi:outer membrane protein OmpA-like peptidoglycan-associated protein
MGEHMKSGSRIESALVALGVTWSVVAMGCHRERQQAERLLTDAVKSYQALPPQVARLRAELDGLRPAVEEVADRVPGGADLRSKFFNADEVLGVLDAKLKWLSGELASIKRDPKQERVVSLREAVAQTFGDIGQVSQVVVELTHENARLHRVAALLQAPYEHVLPTGYRVKAATDGVESHLIELAGGTKVERKANETSWLDFDRLVFSDDGPNLDLASSASQIENVAQILRAYPSMKLIIAGFADTRGSPGADKALSLGMSQSVRKALISRGVDQGRLEAVEYGTARPACSASDLGDCKSRHRRVLARVTVG